MKVPDCPDCKSKRDQLSKNPKGGCVTCFFSNEKTNFEECKKCGTESTPWNHWPRWRGKIND